MNMPPPPPTTVPVLRAWRIIPVSGISPPVWPRFFGRIPFHCHQLAIAGSLMKKNFVNESAGTLRTDTVSFSVILVFVVYIFAALTFFPALALGPVAEHLALWG